MEEQIDVLNADGTSAGYSCGRSKVHAEGLWHRTVHIWAFDSNKRILFQLRSRVKENNPGLLDTSCAGHVSAGDSSVNAAVRELREDQRVLEYVPFMPSTTCGTDWVLSPSFTLKSNICSAK